jgi:hypothetical protein
LKELFLTYPQNKPIEVAAASILASEFGIKAATQVADIALCAYEEDGHLERAALDDDEADDVAFLFGQRLVGLVLGILLLEYIEKLRMLVGYCVAERLSMPIS